MVIKSFVLTPISVKAAIVFLLFSLTVVFAAYNSCKHTQGEFSLDLMSIVITVMTVIIPIIVTSLTEQFTKEVKQEKEQELKELLSGQLEQLKGKLDPLTDLNVTKEQVASFKSQIDENLKSIDSYIKSLYASQEVEKWLQKNVRRKLALDLTQFTLKNFNGGRFSTQFKNQFSDDMRRQIFWIYESIKVNNPQALTPQRKSEMISAKPDNFDMYKFAHIYLLNKKLPKHLSQEAKEIITFYDNKLTEILINHINN